MLERTNPAEGPIARRMKPSQERRRNGLPPLTDEELAIAATNYTTGTVDNLLVQKTLNVSFAYLRHAMIKIAYELAFLWLGEDYLSDALAEELSAAVISPDLASTDKSAGISGGLQIVTRSIGGGFQMKAITSRMPPLSAGWASVSAFESLIFMRPSSW